MSESKLFGGCHPCSRATSATLGAVVALLVVVIDIEVVGVVVAFVVFVSTVVDVSETFWAVVVVLSLGTHCVEASSQRKTQLTKTLLRTQ